MPKNTIPDTDLNKLTVKQISEMTARLKNRRAEITKQLVDEFEHREVSETKIVVEENIREATEVARNLLSGTTAKLPETPARSREADLTIERNGVDIALEVLRKDELRTRAVAAVRWAEENREHWKQLWRRALIARAQALAAEAALLEMRTKAGRIGAELPLAGHVMKGFIVADNAFIEMDRTIAGAIELGYVSSQDLSRAAETGKERRP
jgi:hypothetical protein